MNLPDLAGRLVPVRGMTKRQKTSLLCLASAIGLLATGWILQTWLSKPVATAPLSIDWNNESGNREVSGIADRGDPIRLRGILLKRSSGYEHARTFSGIIRSSQRTQIAFRHGGEIVEFMADEGQTVQKGSTLARLDTAQLAASETALVARLGQARSMLEELRNGPRPETIAAAKAGVEAVREQLTASRLRLARSEQLVITRSISEQEYEQLVHDTRALEARLQNAQSQLDELNAGTRLETIAAQESLVKSLEAELHGIRIRIAESELKAPFAGVIVRRFVDAGAVVASGLPVFDLVDQTNPEVHVSLPAPVASRLVDGAICNVLVNGESLTAGLSAVLPALDTATQTRRAIFDLKLPENGGTEIVDGQLARVELAEQIEQPGFWLPVTSLQSDHGGLWSCLTVSEGAEADIRSLAAGDVIEGTAEKQVVEILHLADRAVYVRGTLSHSAILIRGGLHRVVSGQRVKVEIVDSLTAGDESGQE
jgi:multidrug resistance efflux pump